MFFIFFYVLSAVLTLRFQHPIFVPFFICILSAIRGVYLEAVAGVSGCYLASVLKDNQKQYHWIAICGVLYVIIVHFFTYQSLDQSLLVGFLFAFLLHVARKLMDVSPDEKPLETPPVKST